MNDDPTSNRFDELRARAERIMDAESAEARTEVKRSVSELVEELQTHQIELELQNDELRATQQALEASQARYRELFDFAPASYLIFDPDGLVRDINVTGVDLLRVPRQRILQKPFWLYVWADHRDRFAQHLKSVIDTDHEKVCELELQRKDESRLWVRLHSMLHRGRDGAARVRTALVDITERKHLEKELVVAREEAVRAAQAQQAFLSNMSHEIRTPLTSVIGFAEALGEMVSSGEQREFAQAIKSSGRRLLSTLNSVLDYTRIQNQDDAIPLTRLNVAAQVGECVRILQPQAETQDIQLTSELGNGEAYALLHEDYFGRVLTNMVNNALKYTEEGSVSVHVVQHDDEVEIRVEDTGVGIEKALLNRIFEPFLQADFGPQRRHEGVGLGLAITKRLVDRMDGRLTVESEVGVGSCFSVFFPRVAADDHTLEDDRSPSEHRAAASPYVHLSGTDILVIEDNAETRQLVGLFLKGIARVERAASSAEALSRLEDQAFDGVLLDINLGEERTGLELIDDLRAVDGAHAVPIVAFTAYALPGDKERFMRAGFDSYLQKPFTKRQLLRTLNQVLDPSSRRTRSAPHSTE